MSPFEFFAAIIVQILLMVAAFNVPFVTDAISHSAYTTTEVFSGVMSLLIIVDTGVLIWKVR